MACTPEEIITVEELKTFDKDITTVNEVVTLPSTKTNPASDGKEKLTLQGMQDLFAMTVINLPSGQWAAGVEFSAINQYMNFNGTGYKPKKDTPLPYTSQGADPTIAPDLNFVEPFEDTTQQKVIDSHGIYDGYTAASVADMVLGKTVGGSVVSHKVNEVWRIGESNWKVKSVSSPMTISDFDIISAIILNPKDWGILANGSDETSKWIELIAYASANKCAIGDWIGVTLITSQLAPTAGFAGFICNNELYNVFKKGFNGELIRSGSQAAVYDGFWIQGESTSFTGGGIYAISDDVYFGPSLRVTDTVDAPIIFKGGDATYNTVDRSFLLSVNGNGPCIRSDGVDLSQNPTVRNFEKIRGGGPMPNFDGMNRATCTECFGGAPVFGVNSSKIGLHNNRITTQENVDISGSDHVFTGNMIGLVTGKEVKLLNGSSGVTFDDSNRITRDGSTNVSIIDENPYGGQSTNNISTVLEDTESITQWKGMTSDGTFGNSAVSSFFKREHRLGIFSFTMLRGSTAILPVGAWSITLPFNAAITASGACLIKPSGGGAFVAGTAVVQGNSNQAYFFMNGQASAVDESTYAFGTNAELTFSMSFIIQ